MERGENIRLVRQIDEDEWLMRVNELKRIRRVLKYSEFGPNVKVDPSIFTTECLRADGRQANRRPAQARWKLSRRMRIARVFNSNGMGHGWVGSGYLRHRPIERMSSLALGPSHQMLAGRSVS